eukprot:CAMPEP_0116876470 /NCGR_PEP_ID=MMETSP0463-20121206/8401_1 /TAXON_ID=181622 /ORGANISM="Strombidinopsis sp, Strain SopsisLIS2011" /LENGTH=142 /DNA_ID=CAMNT_0004523085 /DNA_START=659 /DNA_END=1087 /DNA_ORIENTATION=+
MKEPKARDPPWYLKIQLKPVQILADPSPESVFLEKYQVTDDTMITNSFAAIRKATNQSIPKSMNHIMYVVLSFQATSFCCEPAASAVISPTEPTQTRPAIHMMKTVIPMKKKMIGTKMILNVSATKSEAASRTPTEMLRALK